MQDLFDIANRVGARVSREFPGIDPEDVAQEALTSLYEKHNFPEALDEEYLYTVMYRDGRKYAAKERYDYVLATSHYLYTREEVKALLEEVYFQPSSHDVPTAKDDRVSATINAGTVYASLLDIQAAFLKISNSHADILYRCFADGESIHHETVNRALDSLTRAMNIHINRPSDDHGGPGARRAMSNAEAQFMTRNQ